MKASPYAFVSLVSIVSRVWEGSSSSGFGKGGGGGGGGSGSDGLGCEGVIVDGRVGSTLVMHDAGVQPSGICREDPLSRQSESLACSHSCSSLRDGWAAEGCFWKVDFRGFFGGVGGLGVGAW